MCVSVWRSVVWCAIRWFINWEFGFPTSYKNLVVLIGIPMGIHQPMDMEVPRSFGQCWCKKPYTKVK
jgi:hypothetical protein